MSGPWVKTADGWRKVRRPRQSNPRVAELQAIGDRARETREAARVWAHVPDPRPRLAHIDFETHSRAPFMVESTGLNGDLVKWPFDTDPARLGYFRHVDGVYRSHPEAPPVHGRFNCRGDYLWPDGTTTPAQTPNDFFALKPGMSLVGADPFPGARSGRFVDTRTPVPAKPRRWARLLAFLRRLR